MLECFSCWEAREEANAFVQEADGRRVLTAAGRAEIISRLKSCPGISEAHESAFTMRAAPTLEHGSVDFVPANITFFAWDGKIHARGLTQNPMQEDTPLSEEACTELLSRYEAGAFPAKVQAWLAGDPELASK